MFRFIYKAVLLLLITILISLSGCEDFLDEKPNQKLAVPSTLEDLQNLLDNTAAISVNNASLPEVCADDYYNSETNWKALDPFLRNATIWEKDLGTQAVNSWRNQYTAIYYMNSVLEGLQSIERGAGNAQLYDNIKGQALYYRAKSFLLLASLFCKAYDPATASSDLGLPLRTGTDFNKVSKRESVEATYSSILNDLSAASSLLDNSQVHKLRPTRAAAFGLLSRAHLFMRNYPAVGAFADSCLQINNKLLDYNTLKSSDTYPIKYTNDEVLILNRITVPAPLNATSGKIDSNLYRSYHNNDLRKSIYFKKNADNSYGFRGGYEGNGSFFGGQATDEIYLMRAEAFARAGKKDEALRDLNALLEKRFKAGTFVSVSAASADEALELILVERRKELLFRNIRWPDIKRLNKEGRNISLVRKIGEQVYTLPPNDNRFALQIPEDVIALSGMEQNPR
ncbi:RagB/SusD family nutrient uptake outer membrane protein [Desertivirga brevis]|uniref:RagB/SusD family nutrient uptake outer membrane protein n=1 Tax=Desertivirga brevis TaxID=2810310 RepID=UPI001A9605AC|nr:RagB/SusD family nutrient uptake outer membrane protein [Pedobacter sp. SYSU D00873]